MVKTYFKWRQKAQLSLVYGRKEESEYMGAALMTITASGYQTLYQASHTICNLHPYTFMHRFLFPYYI